MTFTAFILLFQIFLPGSSPGHSGSIVELGDSLVRATLDWPDQSPEGGFVFTAPDGRLTQTWVNELTDLEAVKRNKQLFLMIRWPDIKANKPVLYLEGILSGFSIYQNNRLIYPDSLLQKPETIRYNQFHIIPVDTTVKPIRLFLRLNFDHILELGSSRKLLAGDQTDILEHTIRYQQDSLVMAIANLLMGFTLLILANIILLSFLKFPRSIRKILVPFAWLFLVAAVDYLFTANYAFMPVSPIDFHPVVYAVVPLTIIYLLPVFYLIFFIRLYHAGWKQILWWMVGAHLILMLVTAVTLIDPTDFISIPILISELFIVLDFIFLLIILWQYRRSGSGIILTGISFLITFILVILDLSAMTGSQMENFSLYGIGFLLIAASYAFQVGQEYFRTHQIVETVQLELESQKARLSSLQETNMRIQVDALKSQINPHFLFNSFSTLLGLIEEKSEKAGPFVQELSNVYRYILLSKDKNLTELKSELEFLDAYTYLLKQRHQDGLHVEVDVPEAARDLKLPVLTLQLLVENATKHNIISVKKPLIIQIVWQSPGFLSVRNNLQRKPVMTLSTGMGLTNIRERYRFFTELPVEIHETSDRFTVTLPLLPAETPS
ncbi:MAG: histidine kinase [Bacteroidetes bacterium]|nr:histidine kinase [Bacteroidota bacterium]